MRLSELIQTLQLEILSGTEACEVDISRAFISDILSDVMARALKGSLWITSQNNVNVIAIAFFKELSAVILPEGQSLDETAQTKAVEKNVAVLRSSMSAFDLAGKLYALGLRSTGPEGKGT